MPDLPPATLTQRLASQVAPKRLAARMRTRRLPDLSVQFTPIFTIDNLTVPATLIAGDVEQTILGFHVRLSPAICHLVRTTNCKPITYDRVRATQYVHQLFEAGITVITEAGGIHGRGKTARLSVDLTLLSDDELRVATRLALDDGTQIPKPKALAEVYADAGWMSFGKDLVKVAVTKTRLDQVLFEEGGDGILRGSLVPQFLKKIGEHPEIFAELRSTPPLQELAVVAGVASPELRVSGGEDAIQVDPGLACALPDGTVLRRSHADVGALPAGRAFLRFRGGWAEIAGESLESYRRASGELPAEVPLSVKLTGTAIPRALSRLVAVHGRPWKVTISKELADLHPLADRPPSTHFVIERCAIEGVVGFMLSPSYLHGSVSILHDEAGRAIASGEEWVRHSRTWIKPCSRSYEAVEALARAHRLVRRNGGFHVPPERRDVVCEAACGMGNVVESHHDGLAGTFELALRMEDDDSLSTTLRVRLEDGREVPPPSDMAAARSIGGWFGLGDELVRLPATDPALDVLCRNGGRASLWGRHVPRLLLALTSPGHGIGRIVKDDRLQGMRIHIGRATHRLRVTGDADHVAIRSSLVLNTADGVVHELALQDVEQLGATDPDYIRVSDGWIEIRKADLERFLAARAAIGERCPVDTPIRGEDIPASLLKLHRAVKAEAWRVDVSRDVAAHHRTVEAPCVPEFRIDIDAEDGCPQASLHVAYRHDAGVLEQQHVADAIGAGKSWVRHDGGWYAVDEVAFLSVIERCEQLGLYNLGACFRVPLPLLAQAEATLAELGQVTRQPEHLPEGKLNVSLALDGDVLRLTSELTLDDGRAVPKPPSLAQVVDDAGLLVADGAVVQCRLADGEVEQVLLAPNGVTTLAGEAVPALLKAIDTPPAGVRCVDRNESLRPLRVTQGAIAAAVIVDGDAAAIRVEAEVSIRSDLGGAFPFDASAMARCRATGVRFVRVPTGWVEVESSAVEECGRSMAALAQRIPLGTTLEGADIPEALEAVDGAHAAGWERRIAESVAQSHRRAYAAGRVDLKTQQSAAGRRPRMTLVPRYRVGEAVLSHQEATSAIRDARGWLRSDGGWMKVDPEAVSGVERAAANLGLERGSDGFFVPEHARPLSAEAFAGVGELRNIPPQGQRAGLTLALGEAADGRVRGSLALMLDDASVVTPQVSFGELLADGGLACNRGRLLQADLPPQELHSLLVRVTGDIGLGGDDVPRLLDAVRKPESRIRAVRLSQHLEQLRIHRGVPVCRLGVVGDADHVRIEPELVFRDDAGTDAERACVWTDLAAAEPGVDIYTQVNDGWQAVPAQVVEWFQGFDALAARDLPVREAISGNQIPRVLSEIGSMSMKLAGRSNHGVVADAAFSSEVQRHHRLIDAASGVAFSLSLGAHEGRPACVLTPVYLHGEVTLSHEQVQKPLANGKDWVRVPGAWVRIDHAAVRGVTDRAASLKLQPSDRGYRGHHSQREHIREVFSRLGHVSESEAGATPTDLVVTIELDDRDELHIDTRLLTEDGREVPRPADLAMLREDEGWMVSGSELFRVPTSSTVLDEELLTNAGPRRLCGQQVPAFVRHLTEPVEKAFRLRRSARLRGLRVIEGVAHQSLRVAGDQTGVQVDPMIRVESADGEMHDVDDATLMSLGDDSDGYVRTAEGWVEIHRSAIRRYRKGREAVRRITSSGQRIEGSLIPTTLARIKEIEADSRLAGLWNVYYSDEAAEKHRLLEVPARVGFQMNIVESDGQSLLHLDPTYHHERFQFSHGEVSALRGAGNTWARRGASWVKLDTESFERVEKQVEDLGLQRRDDGFTFPAMARERVLPLFSAIGTVEHTKAYAEFIAKLADFNRIETTPPPANIRPGVSLRGYQQHGYDWLAFMQRFGLNGILADDMGLGKTIQTLAAIERAYEVTRSDSPVLIICPTSVVHNWRLEIEKFLSQQRVFLLQGASRVSAAKVVSDMADRRRGGWRHCYVVTSYEIAMRETHRLSAVPWLYVVVDEGHHIKNHAAQRTRAVKTIPGQHKLVLTGTPIQNRLDELWSLFDFAMPGYLGSRAEFGRNYSTGNSVDWPKVRDELSARIRPFVLRRLKKDVAQDLPEKLTIDHEVELTPIQVQLYKDILASDAYRAMIREIDAKGVARAQTHFLGILQKLRAVCNHPVLADDDWSLEDVRSEDSAKLEYLEELLGEVVEGGHRALIFCRSTKMHPILTRCFDAWGIRYLRLYGETSTLERQRMVDQFNSTPDIPVFLLSMAGSTGINLTGADTVIFYDHDWNAANDAQAMDRAYRIGQTRNVTVYRLISKGTIEERILERQRAKQSLADEVIGADAKGFKDLTKEELLSLFKLDGVA